MWWALWSFFGLGWGGGQFSTPSLVLCATLHTRGECCPNRAFFRHSATLLSCLYKALLQSQRAPFACQHVGCLWSSSLKRWRYPREAEDDLDEVGENTPTKCHLVNRNLWLLYTKAIYSDSSLYAFRHGIYGENPFISLMPSVGILFRLKHTGGAYYGSAPHLIKHDITAT